MDEKLRRKISDGNVALKLDKDLNRLLKNNNINLDSLKQSDSAE